jgi:pimeloyl-ACP methyl ester carboxylesterase
MPYSADDIAFERTGSGPPMLLVHGCPATHTLWRPLVPELARHRTVIAVDLPGFGASPAPEDRAELAPTRLARLLLDLASRQGIERFDLVGHSFGGAIAATTAAEAPGRVASLVMLAPMAQEPPPMARLARSWPVRALVAPTWRIVPPPLRRAITRISSRINYGAAHQEERSNEIARELDRGDAVRSICNLVAAFDYADYRRRLEMLARELSVPMLIVGAARDRVIPFRHFDALRRVLARAEQEVFDDGVHVLMWQHAESIADQIVEFVERASTVSHERVGAR